MTELYADKDSSVFHNNIGTLHSIRLASKNHLVVMKTSKKIAIIDPVEACKNKKFLEFEKYPEVTIGGEARCFLKWEDHIIVIQMCKIVFVKNCQVDFTLDFSNYFEVLKEAILLETGIMIIASKKGLASLDLKQPDLRKKP